MNDCEEKNKGGKKRICMYGFLDEKQYEKGSYLSSNEILLIKGQWKKSDGLDKLPFCQGCTVHISLLGIGFRLLTPLHNTSTSSS